jgi:hypothetical protein
MLFMLEWRLMMIRKSEIRSIYTFFILAWFFVLSTSESFSLTITKFEKGPVIDGRVDDAIWQKTPQVLLIEHKNGALKNKTNIRLGYDSRYLYVMAECFELQMAKLSCNFTHQEERDSAIWSDDCVELFIDPLASGTSDFYHIIINPAGVIYDAHNGDTHWNTSIKTATIRSNDRWTVEIAIPFLDLGYALWRRDMADECLP